MTSVMPASISSPIVIHRMLPHTIRHGAGEALITSANHASPISRMPAMFYPISVCKVPTKKKCSYCRRRVTFGCLVGCSISLLRPHVTAMTIHRQNNRLTHVNCLDLSTKRKRTTSVHSPSTTITIALYSFPSLS